MFAPVVHPPEFLRHFFKSYVWKLTPENESQKVLYITVDDGPIPEMTPGTLDLLKRFGAEATFFCVGDNVKKYPEIFGRILAEGHSVGNHTFNHLNGFKTKTGVYIENVEKADLLVNSDLFRPPHGKLRPKQTSALSKGRKIILWDVLTKDYDKKVTKEECWKNVENFAVSGSVIVFHDNLKAMENQRYALEKTLEKFSESGYVFKKIPYKPLENKMLRK